jgi:hypothetical protein
MFTNTVRPSSSGGSVTSAAVAAAIEVTVASISDPAAELALLGTAVPQWAVCKTVAAGTDEATWYRLDATSDATDSPYVVASLTAGLKWVAIAGRYIAGSLVVRGGVDSESSVVALSQVASSNPADTTRIQLHHNSATGGYAASLSPVPVLTADRQYLLPNADITVAGTAGSSVLTSGRVPYATAGGLLTDNANLTYNSATALNIANTTSSTSATTGSLTIGNGTAATNVGIGGGNVTAGALITGANLRSGTGSPEGVVTAPVGTVFERTDGSTGTTLYIKETGAGNTGWVPVTASGNISGLTTNRVVTAASSTTIQTPASVTTSQAWAFTSTVSVVDGNMSIVGSGDPTKTLKFEVDAQSANADLTIDTGAQTVDRTLSIPVLTGNRTLALIDQAQTFTAAQTISAAVASTSTSTGALILSAGGLGVSGAGWFGGNVTATAAANVSVAAITTSTTGFAFGDFQNDLGATFQAGTLGSSRASTIFGLPCANLCTLYTAQYGGTAPTGLAIGNNAAVPLVFGTNAVERMRVDGAGNVSVGTAALSTSAADGFLYIPTCAGTPTGGPTAKTGLAPLVINSTNNKLYFYSGGAWRDAGP